MIRHLLPPIPNYFKAGLHTHTTISDGKLTPEETKAAYQAQGYQILAFTDHEVCIAHPELAEDGFLPLTGYELAFNPPGTHRSLRKTYHLCFIAKDPGNRWQVYDPDVVIGNSAKYADQVVCDGFEPRSYSLEQVNDTIARANAKGFLVTYNHPTWSLQDYTDYCGLKGLWAVEVYNNECFRVGHDEHDSRVYQDLLRLGNHLFPLATDDFHRLPHPSYIAGGWVMVGAEKLDYGCVISALENGDFYASTGPAIHSLDIDGTTVKITCDEARQILIFSGSRNAAEILPHDAASLTAGEFDIGPWLRCWEENGVQDDAFIRIIVTDAKGQRAYSRAYWYHELV